MTKDDIYVKLILGSDAGMESVVLEEDHNRIVEKLLAKIQEQQETIKDLEEYRVMYENLTY